MIAGLILMQLEIDGGAFPTMTCKAAYIGKDKTTLHGQTTKGMDWSEETMDRMFSLIESIEKDMLAEHFETEQEDSQEEDEQFLGNVDSPQV